MMSRRTTRSYNCIWSFLKRKSEEFKPRIFHCDYEGALIKSVKESFSATKKKNTSKSGEQPTIAEDETKVTGCLFHMNQVNILGVHSKNYIIIYLHYIHLHPSSGVRCAANETFVNNSHYRFGKFFSRKFASYVFVTADHLPCSLFYLDLHLEIEVI